MEQCLHVQKDYHNWSSIIQGFRDKVQATIHARALEFLMKTAMLSIADTFMFQKMGDKDIFNQVFRNFEDYEGVVDLTVIRRVTAYAPFCKRW